MTYNFVMIKESLITNVPAFEVYSYEETKSSKVIQWEGKPVHALFLSTETAKSSAGWRGWTDITVEYAAATAKPEPEAEPVIKVKRRTPTRKKTAPRKKATKK